MADDKKKAAAPLDDLTRRHAEASAERKKQIAAATADMREAEQMAREARDRIAALRHKNLAASLAYDAAVAKLAAPAKEPRAA